MPYVRVVGKRQLCMQYHRSTGRFYYLLGMKCCADMTCRCLGRIIILRGRCRRRSFVRCSGFVRFIGSLLFRFLYYCPVLQGKTEGYEFNESGNDHNGFVSFFLVVNCFFVTVVQDREPYRIDWRTVQRRHARRLRDKEFQGENPPAGVSLELLLHFVVRVTQQVDPSFTWQQCGGTICSGILVNHGCSCSTCSRSSSRSCCC
jgi:hypothetical protein